MGLFYKKIAGVYQTRLRANPARPSSPDANNQAAAGTGTAVTSIELI